jgi:CRP-like cAMP-binding protein
MELKEVNILHAGASFGELALISDNVQRTATIIAKTDCEFAVIEKENY